MHDNVFVVLKIFASSGIFENYTDTKIDKIFSCQEVANTYKNIKNEQLDKFEKIYIYYSVRKYNVECEC